jgi:hypothetical protein
MSNNSHYRWLVTLTFAVFFTSLQSLASTTIGNSGKCVDDLSWGTAAGSSIGIYTCDGFQNQSFTFKQVSTGVYTVSNDYSKLCLDDLGFSKTAGSAIAQYACDGMSNQQWKLQQTSSGHYKLINNYSGLCLDTKGGSTSNSTVYVQNSCNSNSTQIFAVSGVSGSGGGGSSNPYASKHVFVLMLENRSDPQALQYMPYMVSVAKQYTIGSQAYSPAHGSFLAYLEMTTGAAPKNGGAYNGSSNPSCSGDGCYNSSGAQTYYVANNGNNIVRQLQAKGLSFRGYFQTMPSVGYMGYSSGYYVRRHNPYPFLQEVFKSTTLQKNMVPWTSSNLANDLASGNVANYTWLVPDLIHDGHNGSSDQTALSAADAYLKAQLPALLKSKYFQPGGDGVLLITFDEGELSGDNACRSTVSSGCGGHIFFAAIGPNVKRSFTYTAHMMQNNMLRATCDLLGISSASCPGDGASATGLSLIFQ